MNNVTDNTDFMRLVDEDVDFKTTPVAVEVADGEVVDVTPVVRSKPQLNEPVIFAEDVAASTVANIPALQYCPSVKRGKVRFSKTISHSDLKKKRQKERRQRRRNRK